MAYWSLQKEVDNLLKKQARIDEKTEKVIDKFLGTNEKAEIYSLIDFVITTGAPKHQILMKEFKEHYEKNCLCLKDISTYLNITNVHKEQMKQSKKEENCTGEPSKEQNNLEEGR